MNVLDVITVLLLVFGALFFLAGTIGILRFPDTLSRMHAVTKADNVGLGLVVLALVCQADSLHSALKLVLVWVMVLVASATSCYLLAGAVTEAGGNREGSTE